MRVGLVMYCWPLDTLPGAMPIGMLRHVIARIDVLLEREQRRRSVAPEAPHG